MKRDIISIIDCGGQYAHLIASRIRRLGVYTEIVTNDVKIKDLKNSSGVIFSGGPQSVYGKTSPKIKKGIYELDVPILGICYGHQTFAYTFGGKKCIGSIPEYGKSKLVLKNTEDLFKGCEDGVVWQNHGDAVIILPDDFEVLASTKNNEFSAMKHIEKPWYSVQFHPEVTHSGEIGEKLFSNFIFEICKVEKSWSMDVYLTELESEIKGFVGDRNVFLLVSGGVDSTVCFVLLNKILGKERVFGLHIDNGFMRKNESNLVLESLKKRGMDNLEVYNAEDEFLDELKGVYDPEEKRKIIGKVYLDVKDRALEKYNLVPEKWLLAQGTIYPDTIESGGTKHADTIKTHHNRVDQIEELIKQGLVVEPLKELYKNEVRTLGMLLNLPDELVNRHPFPGPGLAIRALCSKENLEMSDSNMESKIDDDGFVYTSFNLPVKSVGIKGDSRCYAHPCVIESVYDFKKLKKKMTYITNSDVDVNRVIYKVKASGDIKHAFLHKQHLTKKYMDILRVADDIVMSALQKHKLMSRVWQCPTVILPFGSEMKPYSFVIRPIDSIDAMSAEAVNIGKDVVREIVEKIESAIPEMFAVFYDLTSKPPGTIEWE